MTKIVTLLILLALVCGAAAAQPTEPALPEAGQGPAVFSLQFAPLSFKGRGSTPSTISFQMEYKWLMVGYYHILRSYTDEFKSPTKSNTVGVFYKPGIPIGKLFTISPMAGFFNHRFPTDNGAWWAFGLNATLNVTRRLGFYYQHLSNGGTARLNPGLDVAGMKYAF